MMKWEQIIKQHGMLLSQEGYLEPTDPTRLRIDPINAMGHPSGERRPGARVSYTVQRSVAYGDVKCSATVSIECVQSDVHINLAGQIAFEKAKELCDDGFCSIVQDAARLP
jgi:hypothetical protein